MKNSNSIAKIYTNSQTVSCNGGLKHSNHPAIYLKIGEKNSVTCPYCSLKFIYKDTEITTNNK